MFCSRPVTQLLIPIFSSRYFSAFNLYNNLHSVLCFFFIRFRFPVGNAVDLRNSSDSSSSRRIASNEIISADNDEATDGGDDDDDDDDDDGANTYLAYSGYLDGKFSMFRDNYQNFAKINASKELNDSSIESSPRGSSHGHGRVKRAVTHLFNMILCATGCNPLAYKGYGCYCGFLGSGYPMDGIDRCCKMHDWCYDATECPMFIEYFVPYYWKCYRGYKPICAIEHGDWGSSGSCAQRLCECDRTFAECLRRYRCPRHKAVCTSSPWRLIQNLFMII
ncbi:unnamed protein product [Trichogramma brassicae]|uniref:Phospholipase A2 n=1 Tax=Trichogramma brassicae TaxID=86971 RepID=A0A6H5HXP2_9HYME|nr:unnamed protein product [Trichogramma brassicae]